MIRRCHISPFCLCACVCVCHTLCLHTGADQGKRVAGKLTAGAGNGAAGQQDQHARVGAVGAVLLQVVVLQRLRRDRKNGATINRMFSFKVWLLFHFVVQCCIMSWIYLYMYFFFFYLKKNMKR